MNASVAQPERPVIQTFRDLAVWQNAFALGLSIYRITANFPDCERFGLTNQLRRGAVSIASNIAEGYGRGSTSDYLRFLKIARGALYEVDTQLLFAISLNYISQSDYAAIKDEYDNCQRPLAALIRSIEAQT
jgi:four helix bundle protein